MSRIHQALRKAEREGRTGDQIIAQGKKNSLEQIKQEILGQYSVEGRPSHVAVAETVNEKDLNKRDTPSVTVDLSSNSKLVALIDEKSIPCEQFRALKTKVFQLHQARGYKTLLVTSAGMSEGKTLTATNLTLNMAKEINSRVLLVDGDLRRPAVHKYLGISYSSGLADYLSGKTSMEKVVLATQFPNFNVVLAGAIPDNPVELLNSPRMRSFMTYVTDKFDWVVWDSPPVAALTDAEILSTLMDGVLLVVRAFQTPADLLSKSVEILKGRNILGFVLNGYEDDKAKRYSYYYHRQENQ